jgi:hypothetical protein
VDAWIVMAVWGLVNVVFTVANWQGRIRYEHARASAVATVARSVSAGGTVRDARADGTVLHVEIPPRHA